MFRPLPTEDLQEELYSAGLCKALQTSLKRVFKINPRTRSTNPSIEYLQNDNLPVTIPEDDKGRLSAQFEGDAL